MKKPFIYLAVLTLLVLAVPSIAAVLTVNSGGGADYTSIRSAINAAQSGDELHVAFGTYTGAITMKDGVNVFGGYSGISWTRNPEANVTVIDAGGSGSAVTAANATIDGFTIKGCSSTGSNAGVYVSNCSPTISNNKIIQNGKHGVYVYGNSSTIIEKNLISSNSGDGINCYSFIGGGGPKIYNNTMDSNGGGGIALYAFSPNIKNNIITSSGGYGISANVGSWPASDYNDLHANTSGAYYGIALGPHDKTSDPLYIGAGDYHLQTSPVLSPCIDAGVPVGLPYNNLPDMGAYETAAIQPVPWPPTGLIATPKNAMVRLDWQPNLEPDLAGYKLSYGNVSGNYTNVIDVKNVNEHDVRGLINSATYFFALQAYDTQNNISGYSTEVSATPLAGNPELSHYSWDASYTQPYSVDCTGCHIQPGTFLTASSFNYRYSSSLCLSCHNSAGQARDKLTGSQSHPMYINVTTGGCNRPTYGNITGRFSNRMGDHLDSGKIVCNTCHNSMEKTEDPGRTWEFTTLYTANPWASTFNLQNGGWSWYGYMEPESYSSPVLLSAPTYSKNRKTYKTSAALLDYDPSVGQITLSGYISDYIYVTLDYPYLRVSNDENAMCLDCHNTGTHQLLNCLTCHESHNYKNLHGIRPSIKTPNSGIKDVVFLRYTGVNSFADGGSVYDGICEVCHTTTKYYRNDGTGFANHSGGVNHDRANCTACHTHDKGFAKY